MLMKTLLTLIADARSIYISVASLALTAVAITLLLQYGFGLEPCPLCILQRITLFAVGGVALLGLLCAERPKLGGAVFVLLGATSIFGLMVSMRHIYIQAVPSSTAASCGPSVGYLMDTLPAWAVLVEVLGGTGECSDVSPVLGIPVPIWSLMVFTLVLMVISAHQIHRYRRHRNY